MGAGETRAMASRPGHHAVWGPSAGLGARGLKGPAVVLRAWPFSPSLARPQVKEYNASGRGVIATMLDTKARPGGCRGGECDKVKSAGSPGCARFLLPRHAHTHTYAHPQ